MKVSYYFSGLCKQSCIFHAILIFDVTLSLQLKEVVQKSILIILSIPDLGPPETIFYDEALNSKLHQFATLEM